jgi:hypothetical protein
MARSVHPGGAPKIQEKTMSRTTFLMMSAALALLLGTPSSATTDDTPESTVRVESAGADGGAPQRTAQVQSADYAADAQSAELLPKSRSPLLLGAIGATFLAVAVFFGFRSRRAVPPAG